MTEPLDTSQKKGRPFEFNEAVARARVNFPNETKNITFINLSAPDARNQLQTWLESTDPEYRLRLMHGRTMEEFIDFSLTITAFGATDPLSGKTILCARDALPEGFSYRLDDDKTLGYIFAHELGHCVVPGGIPESMVQMNFAPPPEQAWEICAQINRAENVADLFAAIYGIHEGWLTGASDIEKIAQTAAIAPALHADFTHFTSIALDHLVLEGNIAGFVSLSPRDISAIAARHAEEFSLSARQIRDAYTQFQTAAYPPEKQMQKQMQDADDAEEDDPPPEVTWQRLADTIAGIYLSAPENSHTYYIVRKVLPGVLATGKLGLNGEDIDTSGEHWNRVRQVMAERAGTSEMAALLAALALNKADVTAPPSPDTPAAAAPQPALQKQLLPP